MAERWIGNVEIEKDSEGKPRRVYVVFGPHYFVDIMPDESGKLTMYLGATHHGFRANATEVDGQLERIINEVQKQHPDLSF